MKYVLNTNYNRIKTSIDAIKNGTSNIRPQDLANEASDLFSDEILTESQFNELMGMIGELL